MDHNQQGQGQHGQGRRGHFNRGRRGPERRGLERGQERGQERRQPPAAPDDQPAARGAKGDVDVEQIMRDIRSRIAQRHGIDLSVQQVRELAARRLEAILDPRNISPELLAQLRRSAGAPPVDDPADRAPLPTYAFEEETLYESHRGLLRTMRRILNPLLKLFFNPNPLVHALNTQTRVNVELDRRTAGHEQQQAEWNALHYELLQRMVTENARLSVEVQGLVLRVESLAARVDFADRRVRALEALPPPRHASSQRSPQQAQQAQQTQPQQAQQGHQSQQTTPASVPAVAPSAAFGGAPAAGPRDLPAGSQPEAELTGAAAAGSATGDGAAAPGDAPRKRRRRRRGRRGDRGPGTEGGAELQNGAEGPEDADGDDSDANEATVAAGTDVSAAVQDAPQHTPQPAPQAAPAEGTPAPAGRQDGTSGASDPERDA